MGIRLCSAKECPERNQFGYCKLNMTCSHPELIRYNYYDNKTRLEKVEGRKDK